MCKTEVWMLALLCIFSKFYSGFSNGYLYIGFLSYNNEGNTDYNGSCCDGKGGQDLTCKHLCDFTFSISIFSLDGMNITKKLTQNPVGNSSYVQFADIQGTGVENPMIFDFKSWPGYVQVLVRIYDQDDNEPTVNGMQLVDTITFDITNAAHSLNFIYQELEGQRPGKKSVMRLLFRFDCTGIYTGRECGKRCVSESNTDCITTHNPMSSDCTVPTTETTSSTAPSTSSSVHTTHISTTTSTAKVESSTDGSSNTVLTKINKSTTEMISTFKSSVPSHTLSETTKGTVQSNQNTKHTSIPEVTSSLFRNYTKQTPIVVNKVSQEGVTTLDPPHVSTSKSSGFIFHKMDNWDIILGCVLGGVSLAALVGFLVFYNRQKALSMRNELYRVTPEVKSIVKLNGITGRSDIPFQTHSSST